MKRYAAVFSVLSALLLLLAGCGGGKKETSIAAIQDAKAPEWVLKGSGAFEKDDGKVFYGVGSASGIRNFSLLRSTADNRARSEISKVFEFYTASLMKDYMASTSAGDPNVSSEEQHVEQAIKTVTSQTLTGVTIIDHWQHPKTGELFSLARLDMEAFKNTLEKARELNEKTKEYIRQNADKLHEELNRETDKVQ